MDIFYLNSYKAISLISLTQMRLNLLKSVDVKETIK